MRNMLIILLRILYVMSSFSLANFKIPPLSLSFESDYKCVLVWVSEFILLDFSFIFLPFIKFGEFPAIISSDFPPAPFPLQPNPSLFLFYLPLKCICWSIQWCPTGPLGSVHFSSFFFLFFRCDNFYCLIFKFTDSFFGL